MSHISVNTFYRLLSLAIMVFASSNIQADEPQQRIDYLNFANGVIPIALGGAAEELKIGMDKAMQSIDGNNGVGVI